MKADMDGIRWVDYLLNNTSKLHKIKVDILVKYTTSQQVRLRF